MLITRSHPRRGRPRPTFLLGLAVAVLLAAAAPARAQEGEPAPPTAPTTEAPATTAPPATRPPATAPPTTEAPATTQPPTTRPPATPPPTTAPSSPTTTAPCPPPDPATTTSTTAPGTPPTTAPPGCDDGSTTTTTIDFDQELDPDDDIVADEDTLPPDEIPISDDTVPPAPGEVVDGAAAERLIRRELSVARAEALESRADVDAAAQVVTDLEARLATLQHELARLDVAQQLSVERLEIATEVFEDRVANAVVRGNAAELDTYFTSSSANEAEARQLFLQVITEADIDSVADYKAAQAVVEDGILDALDDLDRTRLALRDARENLRDAIAVNTERKFQLAVFSAGSEIVIRGFVFPVGEPYQFIDSWGFPRMTGTEYEHGHQGTDIMAPFGTPLYAVERGIITRVGTDVLGGTKLWVKGQSGTYYYYAHLQSYAEGIGEGTVVEAGDVVGFVGDTGNAKGGAPHLHFQVHPGGGAAVNPYGLLKVVSDLSRR